MPIVYELDARVSLIRTRCIGYVALEDILGHFDELEADTRVLAGRFDVLLDLTEFTSLPESSELRTVVGSSRVDLQACKLEYSIVSPK